MFRKILICAMFATAAGYCFAAESLPQVVTSEVFYEQEKVVDEGLWEQVDTTVYDVVETYDAYREVPAWPLAGSDADVDVSCTGGVSTKKKQSDNIRIVSKIGTDLVVENNFSAYGNAAIVLNGYDAFYGNDFINTMDVGKNATFKNNTAFLRGGAVYIGGSANDKATFDDGAYFVGNASNSISSFVYSCSGTTISFNSSRSS